MYFPLYIAKRYLFSKKKHSAINIISLICGIGVSIGTMALVCVLSVYNGFQDLIGGTFSQFDPDLRISKVKGKVFDTHETDFLSTLDFVDCFTPSLEENAMIKYGESQTLLTIKGVGKDYSKLVHTDSIMRSGNFILSNERGEFGIVGISTAYRLDINIYQPQPITVFAPIHDKNIEISHPENAFNESDIYLTGIYSLEQDEIDGKYIFTSIDAARKMFGYANDECTSIELKLKDKNKLNQVQKIIKEKLGDDFLVENREEQHQDFFRMLKIEKWITFLILTFILFIAVFNVTGSLSMLIIEKKNDINTLKSLGASTKQIKQIFLLEGWLVSAIGAMAGTIIGLLLCFAQQHWHIIKLAGTGDDTSLLTDHYPVSVIPTDLLAIVCTVWILGVVVAWIPTSIIKKI
ncbi:MAG: FtsX-like permease family protein [Paludibacteraceae bacterium]|nr:FtsX-like permease family protein [Paludibacteraceae bacterium]